VIYSVRLAPAAEADLLRLARFLADADEAAARRARDRIADGLRSLASCRLRELYIRFGDSGYVVQYRMDTDAVIVARIFHMREAR
jgi:plasmid stabilization system protein ParE